MRTFSNSTALQFAAVAFLSVTAWSASQAATITGEYIESRTCDVYTGPCFANGEMGLAGKEAVLAWKVDQGTWQGVGLDGLGVAMVLKSQNTLGDDGVFGMQPGKVDAVLIIDEKATPEQRVALMSLAKDSTAGLDANICRVDTAPITLKNDHLDGRGVLQAGKLARIETRGLRDGDCVCTNEVVYYQPLTKVQNVSPAYTLEQTFQGSGLQSQWKSRETRSSFLATFRK